MAALGSSPTWVFSLFLSCEVGVKPPEASATAERGLEPHRRPSSGPGYAGAPGGSRVFLSPRRSHPRVGSRGA